MKEKRSNSWWGVGAWLLVIVLHFLSILANTGAVAHVGAPPVGGIVVSGLLIALWLFLMVRAGWNGLWRTVVLAGAYWFVAMLFFDVIAPIWAGDSSVPGQEIGVILAVAFSAPPYGVGYFILPGAFVFPVSCLIVGVLCGAAYLLGCMLRWRRAKPDVDKH